MLLTETRIFWFLPVGRGVGGVSSEERHLMCGFHRAALLSQKQEAVGRIRVASALRLQRSAGGTELSRQHLLRATFKFDGKNPPPPKKKKRVWLQS